MPLWVNNKKKKEISVVFTDDTIVIKEKDGPEAILMLAFYPELAEASEEQRQRWELSEDENSLHWAETGTDISIEGLLY